VLTTQHAGYALEEEGEALGRCGVDNGAHSPLRQSRCCCWSRCEKGWPGRGEEATNSSELSQVLILKVWGLASLQVKCSPGRYVKCGLLGFSFRLGFRKGRTSSRDNEEFLNPHPWGSSTSPASMQVTCFHAS